ncbi:MAG: NUDIX hydrolase [Candidatus Magasanikbacteria bacterium]|nr:NUDIX hydrolase [Candidatus Magasanikbacteria bacterium]
MSEFKKISSQILHDNPWWQYKCDKIIRPDGSEGEYCFIETPGNVIIVPVLDDGRLVLVRQYRYLDEKYSIEFPGGGVGKEESPAQAAKRELLEESGYNTENLIKIGAFQPDCGVVKDMSHVFVANELNLVQKPISNAFESTEVLLRRVDEFEDMVKRGEIWNGQVLAAWMIARNLLLNNFPQGDLR